MGISVWLSDRVAQSPKPVFSAARVELAAQCLERARDQARHVDLREAERARDLPLGQTVVEAELEDPALAPRERVEAGRRAFGRRSRGVGIDTARGGLQGQRRARVLERLGLAGLGLGRPRGLCELGERGRAAEPSAELAAQASQPAAQLVQPPGRTHRGTRVAQVTLDLPRHGRPRVRREVDATCRVEAVDRLITPIVPTWTRSSSSAFADAKRRATERTRGRYWTISCSRSASFTATAPFERTKTTVTHLRRKDNGVIVCLYGSACSRRVLREHAPQKSTNCCSRCWLYSPQPERQWRKDLPVVPSASEVTAIVAQALATVPAPPAAPAAPPVAVPDPSGRPDTPPDRGSDAPVARVGASPDAVSSAARTVSPGSDGRLAPQSQPTTAATAAPVQAVRPDAHQLPLTTSSTPTQRQQEESEIAAPNSTSSSLPTTWIWNWNWNCATPPAAPPNPGTINNATGTWPWNWNHNCEQPQSAGQYQGVPTQYQPQNLNVSIRVASPGDNGPVTQTIAAITETTATTVNTIAQTVGQTLQTAAPAPISTIPLPAVFGADSAARAAGLPAVGALITTMLETASALTAAVVLGFRWWCSPRWSSHFRRTCPGSGPSCCPASRPSRRSPARSARDRRTPLCRRRRGTPASRAPGSRRRASRAPPSSRARPSRSLPHGRRCRSRGRRSR